MRRFYGAYLFSESANSTFKNLLDCSFRRDEFQNLLMKNYSITTTKNLTKLNTEVNSENVSLNTANKLYPRTGFNLNQSYLDTVKHHFLSEVQQLNYSNASESAKTINQWVAEQTKNPRSIVNDIRDH